jgi:ATP-dependent exoDNAse (exonuclease V) beta subunit
MFQKKFGKYILVGVIDKLYLTREGWKIVDFKYAHYDRIKLDQHKFQLLFYCYLIKELINPIEASLLYLEDKKEVRLIPSYKTFESELKRRIKLFEKKVV